MEVIEKIYTPAPRPFDKVLIELTREEALFLKYLTGAILGRPDTARRISDRIYDALKELFNRTEYDYWKPDGLFKGYITITGDMHEPRT